MRGPGRPKGSRNRHTIELKDAIRRAAEEVGEDGAGKGKLVGYLRRLAKDEPVAFTSLIKATLPKEIAGDPDAPIIAKIEHVIVRPKDRNA